MQGSTEVQPEEEGNADRPKSKNALKKELKRKRKEQEKARNREHQANRPKSSSSEGGQKSAPIPAQLLQENVSLAMPTVEKEHVQELYDTIAPMWHGTRYKAWPLVEDFIHSLTPQTPSSPAFTPLIADIGCGNGKNIPACNQVGLGIGSDFSFELVRICNKNQFDAICADCMSLPYRTSSFDAAINIAVLHHISTSARRQRLISEALRVVRIGGKVLFYAWALEQDKGSASGHRFETQDVLVPWHVRKDQIERQTHKSEHGELSEESQSIVYQRYCHVYREGELQELVETLPQAQNFVRVEKVYYDTGNWCLIAVKTGDVPSLDLPHAPPRVL